MMTCPNQECSSYGKVTNDQCYECGQHDNPGEWISVKDRLPDINQPVIATMKTDSGDWWYGCCIYKEYGFPWVQFTNPNPVQYWQPLPPPPEADK